MSDSRTPALRPGQQYCSPAQAAVYLGYTERTLRNRISSGDLKAYRGGGRTRSVRLRVTDLDALMVPIPTTDGGRRAS